MDRVNSSYFDDLIDIIDDRDARSKYTRVLTLLYNTEFIAILEEDVNRIIDAKELRMSLNGPVIRPISVLEVLIALAKRCHEDIMYGYKFHGRSSSTAYWFWIMMKNCGLSRLTDQRNFSDDHFNSIILRIMTRSYSFSGSGGLFPLHHPEMDQRYCELWYQLNAYLVENYPI